METAQSSITEDDLSGVMYFFLLYRKEHVLCSLQQVIAMPKLNNRVYAALLDYTIVAYMSSNIIFKVS